MKIKQASYITIGVLVLLNQYAFSAPADTVAQTEQWVMNNLKNGIGANLGLKPIMIGKTISSDFVQNLFVNPPNSRQFRKEGIVISGAIIRGNIFTNQATCDFPVTLQYCTIEGNVSMYNGNFGSNVVFRNCVFDSSLSFIACKANTFEITSCSVKGRGLLSLDNLSCSGGCSIDNVIATTGSFNWMTMGDNMTIESSYFFNLSIEGGTFAQSLLVGKCNIYQYVQAGFVNVKNRFGFLDDNIDSLYASGNANSFLIANLKMKDKIDLNMLKIADDATIQGLSTKTAILSNMVIGNMLTLKKDSIKKNLDLSYTKVNMLRIVRLTCPDSKDSANSFTMEGLAYQDLMYNNSIVADSLRKFLTGYIDKSSFYMQPYNMFEDYCSRTGLNDVADDAYIDYRQQEKKRESLWDATKDFFSYWLFRYGRKPSLTFGWSLLVIALGAFIFRDEKKMKHDPDDKTKCPYNSWWYSIGMFLPLVDDIKTSAFWEPDPKHEFLRFYMRVHALIGWILVPLALATITGVIK